MDFAVFILLLFFMCAISGFRCEVDEKCAFLGNYTASSGNFFLSFYDNLAAPSWRVKNPKRELAMQIWGLYREECGQ